MTADMSALIASVAALKADSQLTQKREMIEFSQLGFGNDSNTCPWSYSTPEYQLRGNYLVVSAGSFASMQSAPAKLTETGFWCDVNGERRGLSGNHKNLNYDGTYVPYEMTFYLRLPLDRNSTVSCTTAFACYVDPFPIGVRWLSTQLIPV